MGPLGSRHVSVWLDDEAPGGGAFAHALEWAARLGLGLQRFTAALEGASLPEKVQACESACRGKGVPWEACAGQGPLSSAVRESLAAGGLCVFGHSLPHRLKTLLLRESRQGTRAGVLVCPNSWRPVSRILVLNLRPEGAGAFLPSAVALCRAFQVEPVVLTVARSGRDAQERQRAAEKMFAAQRWPADFDFIAGCDVPTAVTRAAHWRRCTHIFLERQGNPGWRRWLHGDTLERLLGVSESLTFLALPGAAPPPQSAGVRIAADESTAGSTPGLHEMTR